MKRFVMLCTAIILVLMPVALVFGCQQQPAPAPAPPAPTPAPAPAPTPPPAPAPPPTPPPAPPPPPPPPAKETKTYTNSEYGFSVEYPSDWDILEDYMGVLVAFMGPVESDYMVNISLSREEMPRKMTLEDVVRGGELIDKKTVPNYKKLEEYSTTIAGLPANVQTINGTVKLGGKDLLLKDAVARFVKDKVAYVITYDVLAEFHDEYAHYFELVIGSFKFE